MKLFDLLETESLSHLELINKDANLNREIKYVESTETPDVNTYIEEHSLIITTGMYFKDNQDNLISFIDSLIEKESAGLAIKVDRFLKELDKRVIDYANNRGFPILKIPSETTLGCLYTEIIKQLLDFSGDSLSYVINSQKVFSNILLQKPNLNTILNTLHNITGLEVGLIDPFGNIKSSTPFFNSLYDKIHTRRLLKKISDMSSIVYLKDIYDRNGKPRDIYAYKLNISTYYPYYLLVVNDDNVDIEKNHLIVEQANFAISYTISRHLGQSFYELQKYHLMFDEMLTMDSTSMIKQAQQLPERIFSSGKLAIVSLPNYKKLFPPHMREEGYTLIYQWIKEKISGESEYILIPMEKEFYYLVMTSETNTKSIIEVLQRVSSGLKDSLDYETQITVGPGYNCLDYLKQSYYETMSSVEHGIKDTDYNNVYTTYSHSHKSLFAYIPEEQQVYFCKSILKDLYSQKDSHTKELYNTLRIWLKNNCNVSTTAEELFIHRNTVTYRLDKCKEILGSDLKDPEELFDLNVAFYLM